MRANPISKINEACSFSAFREYGLLKIRSQFCLSLANSSRNSAASQFISGVLNPVAIVVRCVKPLTDKKNERRIFTWFGLVYWTSETMSNQRGELKLVYLLQSRTANEVKNMLTESCELELM